MSNLIEKQAAIKVASKECFELRGVFGRIEEGLNELPTVEAIPIEWLLKRAEMCIGDYSNCLHYAVEDWLKEQKYMVDGRWKFLSKEEENETSRCR